MNKIIRLVILVLFFVGLTAAAAHRFYVAIYKIDFVPQKKRIEITTRIFLDDLNDAVSKANRKTMYIGTEKETPEDLLLLKKYLSQHFRLSVNGKPKDYLYLSSEVENNVLICYLSIKEVPKVNTLEVENSLITELHPEQQNIIQFNNNGKKQNLLLSSSTTKGMLK